MNTARRIKSRTMFSVLLTAVLLISVTGSALAVHGDATLAGSTFEIDNDANLKVDHAATSLDWANVTEIRATDKVNGTGDNSYAGGVKEDTSCP